MCLLLQYQSFMAELGEAPPRMPGMHAMGGGSGAEALRPGGGAHIPPPSSLVRTSQNELVILGGKAFKTKQNS